MRRTGYDSAGVGVAGAGVGNDRIDITRSPAQHRRRCNDTRGGHGHFSVFSPCSFSQEHADNHFQGLTCIVSNVTFCFAMSYVLERRNSFVATNPKTDAI